MHDALMLRKFSVIDRSLSYVVMERWTKLRNTIILIIKFLAKNWNKLSQGSKPSQVKVKLNFAFFPK